MALSGSSYKSFARHRLVTEWTATQNIAKNQSTVTVKVFLQSVDAYGAMYASASNAGNVKVGATTKNFTATSNLSAYQKKQLTSQSFVVSHNANGAGSFSYSVTYNINVTFAGVFYGNQTVTGSGTLNTIPRASSIGTISGDTMGSGITIPITRHSSSFKHTVTISLGGVSVSTGNNKVDTTTTLTPSTESFAPKVTNATSGTATVTLVTYNGTTQIGSAVSKTFTLKVPSSVVPSISEVSTSENATAVANLGLGANRYVQGKSGLKVNATGKGSYGSTIKSLAINFNGVTLNGSGSSFNVGNLTGSQKITITATDSRGRKATATHSITILPYSPPKIVGFKVWRDGTTNKVRASLECSVTPLSKSNGTILGGQWYIDGKVNGVWGTKNTEPLSTKTNSYKNSYIAVTGDYDLTKSFNFRVNLHDALNNKATASGSISTARTLMDFNEDIGVGIGKLHERGSLDVIGDTYIKGYTGLTAGYVNSQGNDVMLHLARTNETPVAVFASNGTAGDFAMNLYNQNGAWTRAHLFKHNGKTEFSGDLTVQYWVYAQKFVQDGQHIYTDRPNGVLWTGGLWMNSDQTVVLPKTIDQAPNGWIIVMQAYSEGLVNKDFTYAVLHKSHPGGGFPVPFYWNWGDNMAGRYMYLDRRNTLRGSRTHEINSSKGGGFVMSKVIEF